MNARISHKDRLINALQPRYGEMESLAIYRVLAEEFPEPDLLAERIDAYLPELLAGRPLQYVLGKAWFYGLTLEVNESVLIPRPETEELVHRILQVYQGVPRLRVLDIGTGSGCIALSLQRGLVSAEVCALDVSEPALEVARGNAARLGLPVHFVWGDISSASWPWAEGRSFDVVVSNPPYITPAERGEMDDHVLAYEPNLALFAPEKSPLYFYEHIAEFAMSHLNPGGRLFVEINRQFGAEVVKLFEQKGFEGVRCLQDMQGADRIVEGIR